MKALYVQHIQEMGVRDPLVVREALENRPVVDGDSALRGYTREAYNKIKPARPGLFTTTHPPESARPLVGYSFAVNVGDGR